MEQIVTNNGTAPSRMTPADRLEEMAQLLATAMQRLWLKRRKEREFCRDNRLALAPEARPPAVNLQQKG